MENYKEKIDEVIRALGVNPSYRNGKEESPLAVVKLGDDNLLLRINGPLTERTRSHFHDKVYFKATIGYSQEDIFQLQQGTPIEELEPGKKVILGELYTIDEAIDKILDQYAMH